ncbi:carbohydrate ABC transporter permease [Paenibacillus sp. NEAU-GSW1]|uniref:carbohydrate ABC transporter permease n=1 Tax=Paenibacillus sp. NEAU-GSW1 TaxID=2682486 RepID=UPI0012E1762B|nr:sugar ABC transporter permease [Paenibacillus sp. NEAU-GSW1]MUT66256.1 ABC transporter permease subunit [Paenibacillus sp. NEAU-GSW1]
MSTRATGAILSALFAGLGQLYNRQWLKGIIFLIIGIGSIYVFIFELFDFVKGLITLGDQPGGFVKVGKMTRLVEGDHSIFMMVKGLAAAFASLLLFSFYLLGIRDAYTVGKAREQGKQPHNFAQSLRSAGHNHFAYIVLLLPFISIMLLTVLPLIFSVLIAFTDYADPILPPAHLLNWVAFDNFIDMFKMSVWGNTFTGILKWTIIWAIIATITTYVGGILVASLIHQKGLRFKKFWRTALIVPFAIPNMVSLLVMRNMFNNQFGPVNAYLRFFGIEGLPWLTDPFWAKVTVVLVNMWIGIPITMILAFGVLTTIPRDLYEAADADGASSMQKFRHITIPFVLFATAPILIMQFAGNINNFNVIYLLTNGEPVNINYQFAGHTDLLVTWLYKLALNQSQFSFASVIGILIFVIVASISIWSYTRTRSYKEEDMIV